MQVSRYNLYQILFHCADNAKAVGLHLEVDFGYDRFSHFRAGWTTTIANAVLLRDNEEVVIVPFFVDYKEDEGGGMCDETEWCGPWEEDEQLLGRRVNDRKMSWGEGVGYLHKAIRLAGAGRHGEKKERLCIVKHVHCVEYEGCDSFRDEGPYSLSEGRARAVELNQQYERLNKSLKELGEWPHARNEAVVVELASPS